MKTKNLIEKWEKKKAGINASISLLMLYDKTNANQLKEFRTFICHFLDLFIEDIKQLNENSDPKGNEP